MWYRVLLGSLRELNHLRNRLTAHVMSCMRVKFCTFTYPLVVHLDTQTPITHNSSANFTCECGLVFPSENDLKNHAQRSHEYRSPCRSYMPTTVCLSCLKAFASRDKLLQHLRCGSVRWFHHLASLYEPFDKLEVQRLDAEAVTRKKSAVASNVPVRPCAQTYGPQLMPADCVTIPHVENYVRSSVL